MRRFIFFMSIFYYQNILILLSDAIFLNKWNEFLFSNTQKQLIL